VARAGRGLGAVALEGRERAPAQGPAYGNRAVVAIVAVDWAQAVWGREAAGVAALGWVEEAALVEVAVQEWVAEPGPE
jgi:hypothetical protein